MYFFEKECFSMVGKRLKLLRIALGFTQKDMAHFGNVTQASYSRYERNLVDPTISFIITLMKNLGVNANWLLIGVGEMFMSEEETNK
jgi:transcriptional regulator with XRE-family HTH domain